MVVSFKVSRRGRRFYPPPPPRPAADPPPATASPYGPPPLPPWDDAAGAVPGLGSGISIPSGISGRNGADPADFDLEPSFALNLFPDGYSIGGLEKGMLVFLIGDDPEKKPYTRASRALLSDIEYGCLPQDILHGIPCKFHNGIVVCEVQDYRSFLSSGGDSSEYEFPKMNRVPTAENNPEDPTQPNRFNAVIEKIERLYMGKHSSDEEDLDDVPDDDEYDTDDSFIDDAELDEYFGVDNLKTNHSGFFVNKGTLEQIESGTSSDVAPNKRRSKDPSGDHIESSQGDYLNISNMPGKASSAAHAGKKLATNNSGPSGTGVPKRRLTNFATGVDAAKRAKISASRDKDPSAQLDFQQKKTFGGENLDQTNKIYHKEKHGVGNFSGITLLTACPTQAMHPITGRESAGTKPKGIRLERAIRDLEKSVAEYKPPTIDSNEVDPNNQASVKRRLPPEIKQKLGKVARLSTNHGKIQEHELTNRLMDIVGHLVQRRTLKRNMKDLVELGLSANQEKADRFQRVKMEINEMVKERIVAKAKVNEQQDGSADDFQAVTDERKALEGKPAMDSVLEDRMCDLYDLYVEGMDEDKGPQSRKLYVEDPCLHPYPDQQETIVMNDEHHSNGIHVTRSTVQSVYAQNDSTAELLYTKMNQKKLEAVQKDVQDKSKRFRNKHFLYAMKKSLVSVNLVITDQTSFRHVIGRPLVQTVNGTCGIVCPTKCVEVQHRMKYEEQYGNGTFSCNAAAPRKVRKVCRLENKWDPKKGANVGEVLKITKNLGGVRTTNAPTPAPTLLPVTSWKIYKWDKSGSLSANHLAELLDTCGPYVGTIWVNPWYDLFDRAQNNDKVYRSGCARDSYLQQVSNVMFKDAGFHAVMIFEYRWCIGDLHLCVQDNHDRVSGPERWIHYKEVEEVQTITVELMERFHP